MDEFQKSLNALYADLYSYMAEGAAVAARTGKPLLVAVGEKHDPLLPGTQAESVFESTVVELMTLDIARKLGIRTVIAEVDQPLLDATKKYGGGNPFGWLVAGAAKEFNVIPGDPAHKSNDENLRRDGIVNTIAAGKQSAVGIYGFYHLEQIGTSDLARTHTILLVNASNMSWEERRKEKQDFPGKIKTNQYVNNPQNAFQAVVEGDIREAADNYAQVQNLAASAGLAYERNRTNTNQAERSYMATLEAVLEAGNVSLSDRAKKELGDIYTVLSEKGNQLQTAGFQKELNEFTTQLAPGIKKVVESIKR